MEARRVERVFIVGGGFSHYAGLPLTSAFTKALLSARHREDTGPSKALVDYLGEFVQRVFLHKRNARPEYWPNLEDLFTCIDLAANSGHHMGPLFPPAKLRTVRRALIVRIFRMLSKRYKSAQDRKDVNWKVLKGFLTNVDYSRTAFISMNWDGVIEHRLYTLDKQPNIDYGCDATQAALPKSGFTVTALGKAKGPLARIIKMHGSTNWLYCDNCRQLFWFSPGNETKIADQLLSEAEWKSIDATAARKGGMWKCAYCPDVALTTRLATFSYTKALEFSMLQKSWFSAESYLRQARKWAFIGYSMPPADYDFKSLLKRIQISRRDPPEFVLVTGGEQAEETYLNFQRFFGTGIQRGKNCFLSGLTEEAISHLVR